MGQPLLGYCLLCTQFPAMFQCILISSKRKKNNSPVSVLKIAQQDLLFGVLLFLVQDVCNTPDSQA